MFQHHGQSMPIPKHLKMHINLPDISNIKCNNQHLRLIVDHTYDELIGGYLFNYVYDLDYESIGELSYLFESLGLEQYIEALASCVLMRLNI